MSVPLAAVLCTTLLVLCVGGGVIPETEDRPQIVDSVKVVIVSKQDDDGKWVNEVKLEHGTELAPWKVEVEQKTLERGGRQSVELTATLTGPRPAPRPAAVPRILAEGIETPQPVALRQISPESLTEKRPEKKELLKAAWRGAWYTLYTAQEDWVTANKTCAEEGAHLAIINSEAESEFLARMLSRFSEAHRGAFVGITDEGQEGKWVTIFGVPIASAGFDRWFRGDQPDNANGKENCGAIYPANGGFNDVPCTKYLMHSICEKEDEATKTEDRWDLENYDYGTLVSDEQEEEDDVEPESDYKTFEGSSSLYKVHTKQMDWATANQTCFEEGAHLAVVNSEGEAMMLVELLTRFYEDAARGAFVGITDEAEEGTWLTIFGETIAQAGFARWFRSDQPDNAGPENCGAIYPTNGGFNDVPCTGFLMHSICEKDDEAERALLRSLEIATQLAATTQEPEEITPETEAPTIDEIEPETGAIDESKTYLYSNNHLETQRDRTVNDPRGLQGLPWGYVQHSDLNYYKLHVGADKNWREAQKVCELEGGSLAHVDSVDEFKFLASMVAQFPMEGSRLAFIDFGSESVWKFSQDYVEYIDAETCSALSDNGGSMLLAMELVRCEDPLPFICEKYRHDVAVVESTPETETFEEFDNTVDLSINSLSNTDESGGVMTVVSYISLERDGAMTAPLPDAELDYDIQSDMETFFEASSETEYEYAQLDDAVDWHDVAMPML